MTDHDNLLFPDRRIDGAFLVTDARGNPVAKVIAAWGAGRFTVTTLDNGRQYEGRTSWWWLSGKWQVTGADGAPLLSVTAKPLRNAAVVQLARGTELILRDSPWRRDFTVVDAESRTVLSGSPRTSALSARQHDYAVLQSTPATLHPAEVIAIVQVWRMVKKSDVAVLAAVSSTTAVAGT